MALHSCAFPSWFTVAAFFVLTSVSRGTVFDMEPSMEKYLPRYDLYYNLSKINECLWDISAQYSDVLSVKMGYRSRLGLAQYVLHINNFLRDKDININSNRSRILLSYGEHAAELFPVQSMFHLLQNITQGYNLPIGTYGRNFTEFVLNNIDLYIVAIVNPDGRTVVERTRNYCWIGTANNVDLNSHLEVSAENKDNVRIVTEPECKVIRDLTSYQRFDALISFHSGDRKIYFPSHGKNFKGDESQNTDVFHLASIFSSLIKDVSLVPVHNSVGGESIFAYASQEKKIPFTFKLGLWSSGVDQPNWPTTECFGFYNPPSETLQTELLDIHHIYPAFFTYISKWKKLQNFREAEKNARLEESQARTSYSTVVFFVLVGCAGTYLVCNLHVPSTWKMFYRRQRRIVSLRTLGTVFSIVSVL